MAPAKQVVDDDVSGILLIYDLAKDKSGGLEHTLPGSSPDSPLRIFDSPHGDFNQLRNEMTR